MKKVNTTQTPPWPTLERLWQTTSNTPNWQKLLDNAQAVNTNISYFTLASTYGFARVNEGKHSNVTPVRFSL